MLIRQLINHLNWLWCEEVARKMCSHIDQQSADPCR